MSPHPPPRRSSDRVVVAVLPRPVLVGLVIAGLALAGSIAGLFVALNNEADLRVANQQLARQNRMLAVRADQESRQTLTALCTFRADLQKRVATTIDYLAQHPEPFILGVPRATFEKSVADQQRTLSSLASLPCAPAGSGHLDRQERAG